MIGFEPVLALDALGADHAGASVVAASAVLETSGAIRHRFALASVTKPLVAYAVLIACEEGSIALDDPLGPPGSTLAHLLAHASGLAPNNEAMQLSAPGERRVYSTAAFGLIARHLEAATGFSMAEYLQAAVFAPLGMIDSELVGHPGSGGVSSVEDLARFARELLAPRLLDRASLDRATTVAFPGLDGVLPGFGRQSPCDFGLGFEIRGTKSPHWTGASNSPATFGHFGQSGTFLWIDPVASIALVVLTDRPFGDWAREALPLISDEVVRVHGLRGGS